MIYENIHHIGCVLVLDRVPCFYMYSDGELDDGIALMVTDEIYTSLKDDELLIVASCADGDGDGDGDIIEDVEDGEIVYTFEPIELYKLKSGLDIIDIIDLKLLNMLFSKLIVKYVDM